MVNQGNNSQCEEHASFIIIKTNLENLLEKFDLRKVDDKGQTGNQEPKLNKKQYTVAKILKQFCGSDSRQSYQPMYYREDFPK